MQNYRFESKSAFVVFVLVIVLSLIFTFVAAVLEKQYWFLPVAVLLFLVVTNKLPPEKGKSLLWYGYFALTLLSGALLTLTGQQWILPILAGLFLFVVL